MGKWSLENKKHGIWMEMIDKAIRDCKGSRSHGLPTGSLIFHDIAEAYLRFLDIVLLKAFRANYSGPFDFKIIRRSDNFEVYFKGVSKEEALDIIVNTLAIYELAINPYKKKYFELYKEDNPSKEFGNSELSALSNLDKTKKVLDLVELASECQDIIPLMLEWAAESNLNHSEFAYAMLDKYDDSILYSPRSVQRLSYLWFICKKHIFSFDFTGGNSRNADLIKMTTITAKSDSEGSYDVFEDVINFYNSLKNRKIKFIERFGFMNFKSAVQVFVKNLPVDITVNDLHEHVNEYQLVDRVEEADCEFDCSSAIKTSRYRALELKADKLKVIANQINKLYPTAIKEVKETVEEDYSQEVNQN